MFIQETVKFAPFETKLVTLTGKLQNANYMVEGEAINCGLVSGNQKEARMYITNNKYTTKIFLAGTHVGTAEPVTEVSAAT